MNQEEFEAKYVNRIHCADCLEVMADWPDKCVDLVLTDPPYNEVNRETNGLRSLDKGLADSAEISIPDLTREFSRLCIGSFYVWCGIEQISFWRREFVGAGLSTRHGIWEKSNPSPMNGQHLWLSSIENCVYAKKRGGTYTKACASPVWRGPIERNQAHPTQKPIWLMAELVCASSLEGDIILDPFCGSGTTCVAAKMLDRNYIGIDISEEYCEIARARLKSVDTGVPVKEAKAGQIGLFE